MLIYSDTYKFVNFNPPKCGTNTMMKVLPQYYDGIIHPPWHNTDVPAGKEGYFRFAILRDPLERACSMYRSLRRNGLFPQEWDMEMFWKKVQAGEWSRITLLSTAKMLKGVKVDQYLFTETLDRDFKTLPFYNGQPAKLPRENVASEIPCTVTNKCVEIIRHLYARDYHLYEGIRREHSNF